MANDAFNNAGFGAGKPIGTGEGESPIVPAQGTGMPPKSAPSGPMEPGRPNTGVRTMNSDMNAVKSGETPKPYPPTGGTTPPPPPPGMATKPGGEAGFELPKMDFNTPTTPPTVGAPGSGTSSPSPMPEPKKKGGKGVFALIITLIVIVGLAVLGYFVIYPMFFATPTVQPTTQPAAATPTVPAGTSTQQAPATPAEAPAPATTTESAATTTQPAAPLPHVSLFKTPADESVTAATITTGATIGDLGISTANSPKLVEVTYADQSGNSIGFSTIMQKVFGSNLTQSAALNGVWNDQNTAGFVYVDASGTPWLGYVTAVSGDAGLAAVKAAFDQTFEANTDWTGLFAADPGTPGTWKTGNTDGIANRYLTFSNGDAVNYGWSGNTLVISASYAGFKDALSKL